MKHKFIFNLIIIFFSATLMFPGIAYDPLIDYYRLKQHYTWLVPEVYYCIYNEANKYYPHVTMDDLCAIIQAESGSARHNNIERMKVAISSSGAIGLMQIMPFHHKGPRTDLYDPKLNIMYGARYYYWCLKYSKGDAREALRCYNAGPASSRRAYRGWGHYVAPIINNSKISVLIYNSYYEVK